MHKEVGYAGFCRCLWVIATIVVKEYDPIIGMLFYIWGKIDAG